MKKIEINKVDESLYYEKLPNGLEVYMVVKNDLKNYYVTFTTKYGSNHNEFIPINGSKFKKYPNGIAHFLEHKMFENENNSNVFEFYSKTGSSCNAYTGNKNTLYLFGGNKAFNSNLKYLLNYVQSPYFTDINVEKEKGIIEQEIKMYEDMATRVLYETALHNIYIKDNMKNPIGGSVSDIKKITKEDLYDNYYTFYNPNNMFLVITGNIDPKKCINIIRKNQLEKKFKKQDNIVLKEIDESDETSKEYEEKVMDVEIPYFVFGIKISTRSINNIGLIKQRYYFDVIASYLFGKTSTFYESVTENYLIDQPYEVDIINTNNHKCITIFCKSKKYTELIEKIKENIKNISIPSSYLDRVKKVMINSLIYTFENINWINSSIVDNIIEYKEYNTNQYDIINNLNYEELNDILNNISFKNISITVAKNKDK